MAKGIFGKKIGMMDMFTDEGNAVNVSVVEAGPCPVTAVNEKSIQLAYGKVKESKVKKPQAGMFKKLNIEMHKHIGEVKREPSVEYKVGDMIKVDLFKPGDFVDVTGTSKGKGFQGGMKRWHWKGGPMTHGSTSHRRVGSIGSTTSPGRVWKGHHMPGHMGGQQVTVQNLKVVRVDAENNLLMIEGAVPGAKNGYLIINKAKKKTAKVKKAA